MLNSEPIATESADAEQASVLQVLGAGAVGALALAGIATFIVMVIWFAFYLLVFVPRGGAP